MTVFKIIAIRTKVNNHPITSRFLKFDWRNKGFTGLQRLRKVNVIAARRDRNIKWEYTPY